MDIVNTTEHHLWQDREGQVTNGPTECAWHCFGVSSRIRWKCQKTLMLVQVGMGACMYWVDCLLLMRALCIHRTGIGTEITRLKSGQRCELADKTVIAFKSASQQAPH
jgi:hypothetical protein